MRMKIKGSMTGRASTLRVTPDQRTLLVNNEDQRVIACEINQKGDIGTLYSCKQIEIAKSCGDQISDIQPFGTNGVAMLTKDGWISLHQFDFLTGKSFEISKTKIPMGQEEAVVLSICPKMKVFACHTAHSESTFEASRVVIYELSNGEFTFTDAYHLFDSGLSSFQTMLAHGYYQQERDLIISAVTFSYEDLSSILTLCYDTNTKKVRELGNIRKDVVAKGVRGMTKVGDELLGLDFKSRNMVVTYRF